LLHTFGGIYADLDTECLKSFEPLFKELEEKHQRIVLAEEPQKHAEALNRKQVLGNAIIASMPGHPLWLAVINHMTRMFSERKDDVLGATGPLLITAVYEQNRSLFQV